MTGIPSWAVRGAKVVCVDTGLPDVPSVIVPAPLPTDLVEGRIFTIRDVVVHLYSGQPGVRLVEIKRPIVGMDTYEQPFGFWRFRPLITRSQEQDIAEHFSHHLDQRVPEKA